MLVYMVDKALLGGPLAQPAEVKAHYERSRDSLIMMVDDEPILMGVAQVFLEEAGYSRFILCEDSSAAIDIIKEQSPDVLLLDLVMPGITGFDILFELSKSEETRYLPVIVLTSSSDSETKLKALEMGATDFLAKPVDASELSLRLRNTLTVKAYQDRLANFDQLTGLANRASFLERLEWAMRRLRLENEKRNVLLLGLDRFKQINDTLPPGVGDELLVRVANRLNDVILSKNEDTAVLARLGGDEFALLYKPVSDASLTGLADALLAEIREPFHIDDTTEVFLTGSIGISSTTDVEHHAELLQKASVAEKFAKQSGRDRFQVYSTEIDAESAGLLQMEGDLRKALENDQLELHYQPKLDAKSHKIIGMEALIRWHLNGDLISPLQFIPIAEDSGLIVPIGEWILKTACRQAQELETIGFDTKVSVNVSGHQIPDPNLTNAINLALNESGLAPERLIIEITESVMMGDVPKSLEVLDRIRSLGVALSVDDFGTGYSSLSYLKRFPISELKIDQSFVFGLPDNSEDATIVRAILAMAHALDLTVTAEGVETLEQAKFLAQYDCETLQGYYFSKPLPFNQFREFAMAYDGAETAS